MKRFQLVRVSQEPSCCRGVLLIERVPFCVTLELPWRDNQPNVSCIPEGDYECRTVPFTKDATAGLGIAFKVLDVHARQGILIHVGNYPSDTQGCILLGRSYSQTEEGEPCIGGSRDAYLAFMEATEQEPFKLAIMDPWVCEKKQ